MSEDTPVVVEATEKKTDAKKRGWPKGKPRGRQSNHGPNREPKGRAERIPLGAPQLKLATQKIPGFVSRWINDKGSRVQQALQGGYYFVEKGDTVARTTDLGDSCISQIVGTKESGEPMSAYLMKIPEKWHREDQAAKKGRRDEIVAQIEGGTDEKGGPGQDGRYLPKVLTNRLGS